MAESSGAEKTEKATPRRVSEARKKGQVAKSQDINTAVVLLAGIIMLRLQFSAMGDRIRALTERALSNLPKTDFTPTHFNAICREYATQFFWLLAPTLGVLLLVGLIANYAQVGFLFTSEPITPKLEKINPLAGFKRLFSRRSAVEVLKAIIKMSTVGFLVYRVIADKFAQLSAAVLMDRSTIAALIGDTAWEIAWRGVFALAIFGLLDYIYQRWEFMKGLRMTKQEVKDESKQSEGDPLIKGRIRRAQRDASRRRMMSDVPKATVVITNPTHFAVALMYDREAMGAPRVVAKGVDLIAQRIKEVAKEAEVPIMENVQLARELYKRAEIGDEIPEELYAAVAEILVLLKRLNKKRRLTLR